MTTIRKPRSRGLGGTYFHFRDVPSGMSSIEVQQFLADHTATWAAEIFDRPIVVEVIVVEGSIKAKLVYGGLTLVNILASYGSLRDGIDHVVADTARVSNLVIERFLAHEGLAEDDVYRIERRLGVPGKIQRFFRSLDYLNSDEISNRERGELIEELQEEFLSILVLLDDEKDQELFRQYVPNEDVNPPDLPNPDPIRGAFTLDSGPPQRRKKDKKKDAGKRGG